MLYRNPALIASKKKVLELSHSPGRLCHRILLNALDVMNSDSWDRSMTINCCLRQNGRQANAQILVDTGASGIGFINKIFIQDNSFTLTPLNRHINIFKFDSKYTVSGRITYIVALRLQYLNHKELIKLFITTLGHLVILRQP